MKITLDRKALAAALKAAAGVADPAGHLGMAGNRRVTSYVRLAAGPAAAALHATDTMVSLSVALAGCEVDGPGGEALLCPAVAARCCAEFTGERLSLEADGGLVRYAAGFCEVEQAGAPASDWPAPRLPEGEPFAVAPAGALRAALAAVTWAARRQERANMPALCGVQLLCAGPTLALAGSDGGALAWAELGQSGGRDAAPVVPRGALDRLATALAPVADAAPVEVRADASLCSFAWPGGLLSARQQEGRFPRWRDVVPASFPGEARLPAGRLLAALRQAAVMCDDGLKGVHFTWAGGRLELRSKEEVGRALAVVAGLGGLHPHQGRYDAAGLVRALEKVAADAEVAVRYGGKGGQLLVDAGPAFRFLTAALGDRQEAAA